ncbi:hypothetical protein FA15DRAFT_674620 [Coprinopsis marcescibilis]|uniref:Oxidoreductase AflY n=1 Tax=Coprinopsis marcescibilis TaxID=230819 RepID=A0A5C3KGN0_COPMA|nr:hypothetical protein FA15DRAFT_674620 [Coprinopsis marcescibilis]
MAAEPLEFLFPVPSPPPSRLAPPHWPGVSPESTKALLTALKDNHERWHIFINEKHFHNHAPHRSLALWALGADGKVITAGYKNDCGYEKPTIPPPDKITKENFTEHLGDERFYKSYVDFFSHAIRDSGIGGALEEYLFSPKANVGETNGIPQDKQPRMMARFFSGVVHPLIHTGNGVEFNLPGLVAEGLAQTAVHPPATAPLIPPSLFETSTFKNVIGMAETAGRAIHNAFGSTVDSLDFALDSVLQKSLHIGDSALKPTTASSKNTESGDNVETGGVQTKDVHALDILGWVSKALRTAPTPDEKNSFDTVIGKHAHRLLKFADLWKLDADKLGKDEKYLHGKIEELVWMVTVMYGVGGWTGRGQEQDGSDEHFNADFFLMHLVTSSVFIPSIAASISPIARARFLHSYMVVALAMYVFRGCPPLDIANFQKLKDIPPSGPQPHPSKGTLPSPDSYEAVNADPWLSLLQNTIVHPDEHLTKIQRSLSNWASQFGTRMFRSAPANKAMGVRVVEGHGEDAAGLGLGWDIDVSVATAPANGETVGDDQTIVLDLDGADHLDGLLFLRTAELTASRLGRVREGEPAGPFWDFSGYYLSDGSGRKAHL